MINTTENSLVSTLIKRQEPLNDYRNLKQQDIQTPSHFLNEELAVTIPTTTH